MASSINIYFEREEEGREKSMKAAYDGDGLVVCLRVSII